MSRLEKPKILQINVVYGKGSTGRIVQSIHSRLISENLDSVVCFGRGNVIKEPKIFKASSEIVMKIQSFRARLSGLAYSGCAISTFNILRLIKKEKPSIVHLHNLNGYFVNIYLLLRFLKKNSIPTVLTLHAEFMFTGGCGNTLGCDKYLTYCGKCPQKGEGLPSSRIFDQSSRQWKKMKKALCDFETIVFTAVSGQLAHKATHSPIMSGRKITIIENGIDTDIFRPTNCLDLVSKYSLFSRKVVLHVTPDFRNPIKGGTYVIELAKRLKCHNITIIILGYNGRDDALPDNIVPVSHCNNQQELAKFYSLADVTLLTSKAETFSMVCAESLSCGTPVVGFKAGGPESISIKEFSDFVDQDDLDALETKILEWLHNVKDLRETISREAKERYTRTKMVSDYLKLYRAIYSQDKMQ